MARELERLGQPELAVGVEPDRRGGERGEPSGGVRPAVMARVVDGEQERGPRVPGRTARIASDGLEDRLRLGALSVVEQIRGARELGVVVGGDRDGKVGGRPSREKQQEQNSRGGSEKE